MRKLLEKRSSIVREMRALTEKPAGDGGDLSAEQEQRFDTLKADLEGVERSISRQALLDEAEKRMDGAVVAGSGDAKLDMELRSFSIVRAIASQVPDLHVDAGRERELSAELQRRNGTATEGIQIPMQVFQVRTADISTTAPTSNTGANIIPTDYKANEFIDMLRQKLVVGRLGCRVLNGLRGNVDIPKQTVAGTSYWVAEDAAITNTAIGFGKVSMTPKHCGMITEITRNMILQSSPDVEALVRADFAYGLARAIDDAAIVGTGSNGQPTGVLNTSGIGAVAMGTNGLALDWANLLKLIDTVGDQNVDLGNCSILTNSKVVSKARQTLKVSADAGAGWLFDSRTSADGFPVVASPVMPSNLTKGTSSGVCSAMLFGDFSQIIVGYWDSFSLLVNPYAASSYSKGNVQVRAMLTADVAVRNVAAFAAVKDLLTA